MRLGPFQIEHPFILAPMAGITHSPFRRLMRRMDSALVVSELISANGLEYNSVRTLDLLRFHPDEKHVGLQIFGENKDILIKACQHIERLGADFVDLNLGCPVAKIVQKGAGAALCRNPSELKKILHAMVQSISIPVTIKIRTGWDANHRNALDVIHAATDAGVQWVAIHGRTRAQGYSGEADWDFIGEMKQKSSIPIIGNGDINDAFTAVKRIRDYNLDAVLIGRGALRNPFIFTQAKAIWTGNAPRKPASQDYLSLMAEHKNYLDEVYEERIAGLHIRKFFAWYSSGFPGCHEFRSKIFKITEPSVLWEEAVQFFTTSIEKQDQSIYSEPFLMGGHG